MYHHTALVDDSQCKAALAAHLHSGFVPLLAAALACLAATPTTQHPDLQMMASTCEVLAFYLLHTPSKATTGSKLLSSGALRALSQLFAKHALQHDAEALRCVRKRFPCMSTTWRHMSDMAPCAQAVHPIRSSSHT